MFKCLKGQYNFLLELWYLKSEHKSLFAVMDSWGVKGFKHGLFLVFPNSLALGSFAQDACNSRHTSQPMHTLHVLHR